MKFNLYTIRDCVAEQCGPVFQAVNDGVALRNVRAMMDKVPDYDRDAYKMFRLGVFDDEKCEIYYDQKVEEVSIRFPKFSELPDRKLVEEK